MALSTEQQNSYQQAFQRYLGRQATQGELNAATSSSTPFEDQLRGILNSPEFVNRQRQAAIDAYQPQFLQLGNAEAQANDQYANLLQSLEQRQKDLPEQVLGQFNRRGLLRSGLAVEGLGRQQADLGRSITSTQQARAYKLADLAAKRAQLILQQSQYQADLLEQPAEALEKSIATAQAAEQRAARSSSRSSRSSSAGGYTASELRKLRAAGIDSGDTRAADDFLYNKISQKDLDAAGALVGQYDVGGPNKNVEFNPSDTGDRLLSRRQAEEALKALMKQAGGNRTKAATLFQRVIADAGYQPYGDYSFGDLDF